jgi:hypothetical protein
MIDLIKSIYDGVGCFDVLMVVLMIVVIFSGLSCFSSYSDWFTSGVSSGRSGGVVGEGDEFD